MIEKALYFGLGVISVTREKAEKIVEELVERGEVTKEEAKKTVDELISKGEEEKSNVRSMIRDEVENIKGKWALVNRTEFEELKKRVELLEGNLAPEPTPELTQEPTQD